MDFIDPKKKRAHTIRLYVGYMLMAIALGIGTLILLYETFGYDLDRRTGQVIQNGLVFVDSHPESAEVYVNGRREGATDMRLVVPSGQYAVELRRPGYRAWQRNFRLAGSVVERLVYPFLFPEELEPVEVRRYAQAPRLVSQSLDRNWLLVQPTGNVRALEVIDLARADNPVARVSLPEDLLSSVNASSRLRVIEWASDNRRALIRHTNGARSEYVVVDREAPEESFNINRTFDLEPQQVTLRDRRFDRLDILDSERTLHLGAIRSRELTEIASGVTAFKSYGDDTVLYVTSDDAPDGQMRVAIRRGDNVYRLRDLPRAAGYVVDISRYDRRWYFVVGARGGDRAYVYADPFDLIARDNPITPAPVAVLHVSRLRAVSFATNARFIAAQGSSDFEVYDAEHDRAHAYNTRLRFSATQEAKWMDGHRFAMVVNGRVTIYDFDGTNVQQLNPALAGTAPYFDQDYDNWYTISSAAAGQSEVLLTRTSARTAADR